MFSGALVGVLLGEEPSPTGEQSPLDAQYSLTGTREMGPDWDLALFEDRLLASSPNEGTVRSYLFEEIEDATSSDSEGIVFGERVQDHFGAAIARISDFDGDGTADLVVGAPQFTVSGSTRHDGAVYLFSGMGDGIDGRHQADEANLRVSGDDSGGRLGDRVIGCGDIDGDGLDDWTASALWDNSGAALAGRVVLARSSTLSDLGTQVLAGALETSWVGAHIGARAGNDVACTHDLTGDEFPDLLISAPFADSEDGLDAVGAVYLIAGGPEPVPGPLFSAAVQIIEGDEVDSWFGWSIATGDLNGDGLPELAIGAPGSEDAAGSVHIWDGVFLDPATASPQYLVTGALAADGLGRSVTIADFDGDGFGDLAIGAPFVNPTDEASTYDSGALYIFRGSDELAEWSNAMTPADADLTIIEAQQYLRTGQVVRAGDFNADGRADLALLHRIEPTL